MIFAKIPFGGNHPFGGLDAGGIPHPSAERVISDPCLGLGRAIILEIGIEESRQHVKLICEGRLHRGIGGQ
jgi:hypothetical protein